MVVPGAGIERGRGARVWVVRVSGVERQEEFVGVEVEDFSTLADGAAELGGGQEEVGWCGGGVGGDGEVAVVVLDVDRVVVPRDSGIYAG